MNITNSKWTLQIAYKINQSTNKNTDIHIIIRFYVVNIKLYISKYTSEILCFNIIHVEKDVRLFKIVPHQLIQF